MVSAFQVSQANKSRGAWFRSRISLTSLYEMSEIHLLLCTLHNHTSSSNWNSSSRSLTHPKLLVFAHKRFVYYSLESGYASRMASIESGHGSPEMISRTRDKRLVSAFAEELQKNQSGPPVGWVLLAEVILHVLILSTKLRCNSLHVEAWGQGYGDHAFMLLSDLLSTQLQVGSTRNICRTRFLLVWGGEVFLSYGEQFPRWVCGHAPTENTFWTSWCHEIFFPAIWPPPAVHEFRAHELLLPHYLHFALSEIMTSWSLGESGEERGGRGGGRDPSTFFLYKIMNLSDSFLVLKLRFPLQVIHP